MLSRPTETAMPPVVPPTSFPILRKTSIHDITPLRVLDGQGSQHQSTGGRDESVLAPARRPTRSTGTPGAPEALARARAEDRPIFLSIGYSACHWCHVMERESFENPDIAAVMNDHFVNIKVDREERPDLDQIYMSAVQAMTGHGGWPMSVFLTPDLKPFFGGTYFPPTDSRGMAGFPRVLLSVYRAWEERRDEIRRVGDRDDRATPQLRHTPKRFRHARSRLARPGGPGRDRATSIRSTAGSAAHPSSPPDGPQDALAPSCPHRRSAGVHAVRHTLDEDGPGRHLRQSRWRLRPVLDRRPMAGPHFEKMLYDNACSPRRISRRTRRHMIPSSAAWLARRWITSWAA